MKSSWVSPTHRLSYWCWKRPPTVIAAHPRANARPGIHEQRQADRGQGGQPHRNEAEERQNQGSVPLCAASLLLQGTIEVFKLLFSPLRPNYVPLMHHHWKVLWAERDRNYCILKKWLLTQFGCLSCMFTHCTRVELCFICGANGMYIQ